MGGSGSRLSKELLAEYQDLTFLTKQEILLSVYVVLAPHLVDNEQQARSGNEHTGRPIAENTDSSPLSTRAHRRFCELLPQEQRSVESSLRAQVPFEQILSLPELKANPFKERICRVFSTSPAKDSLSFEDFLDLLSVFSDTATPDIKSHYAFRIFDFDDDGTLNREDLSRLVNCLTGEGEDTRLSASEMKQLIDNILEESDIDRDGTINLSEFQHVISRSPDFASSFKIVL
ncbi:calcium and integrin binding 1 [Homo sapiens]|uniref:Isoform 2 of Calcium and integrin-binding protein 1 n=1 Tax=Homo sapiens TaxID=9606 RepID=Q99828-2|nr:calcium and integrin-binding protein 1 isoform a [Homo sapiens]KAI2575837.1 calcium and integrin binding 1 [Homo sapiens]KAI4059436.1 calcium and integrin binding 1 [Homo sapiens]|eukprot:NP_001264693.1 calcium and integrin-binding protein 1 isoform a [Homo sapiens]